MITWGEILLEFPFKSKIGIRFGTGGDNVYFLIAGNKLTVHRTNKLNNSITDDNYFTFIFCI